MFKRKQRRNREKTMEEIKFLISSFVNDLLRKKSLTRVDLKEFDEKLAEIVKKINSREKAELAQSVDEMFRIEISRVRELIEKARREGKNLMQKMALMGVQRPRLMLVRLKRLERMIKAYEDLISHLEMMRDRIVSTIIAMPTWQAVETIRNLDRVVFAEEEYEKHLYEEHEAMVEEMAGISEEELASLGETFGVSIKLAPASEKPIEEKMEEEEETTS